MKLYNTLTKQKEELTKPEGRPFNMFVCGPTVYDEAHLGHARTYIAFDALVRFLRSEQWDIFYLQNITDVDDKIIERARAQSVDPAELAGQFERTYKETMRRIDVTSVDEYARASSYIKEITTQIQSLIAKGHAYCIEGSGYYFDISTFPDYGKLSGRTATQAEDAVTRIDEGIQKKNKGDFALWKFVSVPENDSRKKHMVVEGEPAWHSALGWGRPGWHIEDTAITESFFGPQYDLHGGAEDLKFPHHEAEIAQQEASSGMKPFVRYWLHTGFMRIRGEKMSKSLKNFVTVNEFLATHSATALRWFVLSHHYRSPINFDDATVLSSLRGLDTVQQMIDALRFIHKKGIKEASPTRAPLPDIDTLLSSWHEALSDDFNTPEAFAAVFTYINSLQPILWTLTRDEASTLKEQLVAVLETIGIYLSPTIIPKNVEVLAKERELYRGSKQFTHADDLRTKIDDLGYSVDDTPLGPLTRKAVR
jgi:cysteinyl-tRNA synthetase